LPPHQFLGRTSSTKGLHRAPSKFFSYIDLEVLPQGSILCPIQIIIILLQSKQKMPFLISSGETLSLFF
jgi:hypothetical protein